MPTAATPLSSQPMLTAQAGGRAGGREGALLRLGHCSLLSSSHSLPFPAEPGWPGAELRPRSNQEVDGDRAPRGRGPRPKGEGSGTGSSPHSSPLNSQHRNTSSPTSPRGGILSPGSKGAGR